MANAVKNSVATAAVCPWSFPHRQREPASPLLGAAWLYWRRHESVRNDQSSYPNGLVAPQRPDHQPGGGASTRWASACLAPAARAIPAGLMCAAGMGLCSQLSEHPAIAAESNHLAGVMLMAEHAADEAAVDAALSASRSLIAGPARSIRMCWRDAGGPGWGSACRPRPHPPPESQASTCQLSGFVKIGRVDDRVSAQRKERCRAYQRRHGRPGRDCPCRLERHPACRDVVWGCVVNISGTLDNVQGRLSPPRSGLSQNIPPEFRSSCTSQPCGQR